MKNKLLILAACAAIATGCKGGGTDIPPTPPGGGGGTPNINVSPTSVSFTAAVGATADQTVTVSNNGTDTLVVNSISTPAAPFSRNGGSCTNGLALAVGNSCTVVLRFAPVAAGTPSATINIASTDPDAGTANGQNSVAVTLNGTASAAPLRNISLDATSVGFGTVNTGSTASRTVTVSNSGNADLTLGTLTSPAAPFSRTGGTCTNGQVLAGSASCTIVLQYAPTATGAATGSFNVPSDDPDAGTANGQNNVAVSLSGTGATPPAVTYHYYQGSPSAPASNVAGLYRVSSSTPASPATVDGNALLVLRTVHIGSLDSATGVVSNYRNYAVVFASGGRLHKHYAEQTQAPAQISNVTTIANGKGDGLAGSSANDLCFMETVADLANPENSVVIYGQAGLDASCDTSDDNYFWLRLNTSSSTAPVALIDLPVAPVTNNTGAITNFLVINSATGALEKRDASFGGTATVIAAGPYAVTGNDKFIWITSLSPTRHLLHLPPACLALPCPTSGELRIVDASTNTLSSALGTTGNRAAWLYNFVADSSHVYFVSNDAAGDSTGVIQRFPVNGTAAATTFRNAGAVQIPYLSLTANSVIYPTVNGTNPGVYAAPKNGAVPVTLATSGVSDNVYIAGIGNNGMVYINRAATNPTASRALVIRDDGTGLVTFGATNGATWAGNHYATTFNAYVSDDVYFITRLVLTEYTATATPTNIGGATLSVVDGGTGAKNGVVLGTVDSGIHYIFGFGDGTRALYQAQDGDSEIFYVDTESGVFTRVTTDSVNQSPVYW